MEKAQLHRDSMDRNDLEARIAIFNHDIISNWEVFAKCLRLVTLLGYHIIKLTSDSFQDAYFVFYE